MVGMVFMAGASDIAASRFIVHLPGSSQSIAGARSVGTRTVVVNGSLNLFIQMVWSIFGQSEGRYGAIYFILIVVFLSFRFEMFTKLLIFNAL